MTEEKINVRVLCFSHLKHALGRSEIVLALSPGSTTREVEALVREMGGAKIATLPLRVARNQRYCLGPEEVRDGDEVALIPPVQGG